MTPPNYQEILLYEMLQRPHIEIKGWYGPQMHDRV
jgi:hypothetical protein